ncbi:MAG TPA: S1C family serine protease [Acidimicrobiia bacterium]|nr:S1C family serine protease [Acidimicrobiia bacterium]
MDSNPEPQAEPGSDTPHAPHDPRELIAASVPPPPPAPPVPPAPPAPALAETAPAPGGSRGNQQRTLAIVAAIFLLVGSAFVGFGARDGWFSNASSSSAIAANPNANGSASTVDNSSSASGDTIDSGAVADNVDNAIVNITSVTQDGVGAGTGMIVSSKGLVLTNHHVIAGAEHLQVEIGGNGDMHDAHVVGYSIADDVALVQIDDVSGLPTIDTADEPSPQDSVLVIGNALGRGGDPTVSSGRVVALDQQITATDENGNDAETLTGMIQIAASVQPGQSGGAVVNADGKVVGMTTAASVNGGFRVESGSGEAYAIPIARALAAIQEIEKGSSTADVHVGPRAVMGIGIPPDTGARTPNASGVPVSQVTAGSPADDAGITVGSTIVAIGDTTVRSGDDVVRAMNTLTPDDSVKVTWLDGSGTRHTATVQLDEGPPA